LPAERRLEDGRGKLDAKVIELVGEPRPHTGRNGLAKKTPVAVNARREIEDESVLQGDHVALHADHLAGLNHFATAIAEACDLTIDKTASFPLPRVFGRWFVYNETVTVARLKPQ